MLNSLRIFITFVCIGFFLTVLSQSSSFGVGERVNVVVEKVKVRDGAGLSFNTLGIQEQSAIGTVLADSGGLVDGYLWLQIDYDNGVDGWSAVGDANEAFIEKAVPQQTSTEPVTPAGSIHPLDMSGDPSSVYEAWKKVTPDEVKVWLQAGVDVNARNQNGTTALMYAVSNENSEIISLLLQSGADVNARNVEGGTALITASSRQTPEVISLLLQAGADVNARDDYHGETALIRAIFESENLEVISLLLQSGANVDASNKFSRTALMYAVYNENSEITSLLLRSGADVNARSVEGGTALMEAAAGNESLEVISLLLQAGAEVNASTQDGKTALMFSALLNESPEVVLLLLQAGADAKAIDMDGKRAIDYAEENEALKGTDAYWQLNDASF